MMTLKKFNVSSQQFLNLIFIYRKIHNFFKSIKVNKPRTYLKDEKSFKPFI